MSGILVAAGAVAGAARHVLRKYVLHTAAERSVVDGVRPHVVGRDQPSPRKTPLHRSLQTVEGAAAFIVTELDAPELGIGPRAGQRIDQVGVAAVQYVGPLRSEEHTSELQSL